MDGCGARATVDLFLARQRARYAGGDKGPVAELLAGEDVVVQLADGRAVLGGEPAHRRTAGVYRVAQGRIAEAWLVPLELDAFDAAWRRAEPR